MDPISGRVRASALSRLSQIGRQAKAIVRDYSDRELAIAQGIENASRQDLSWIEKRSFAATMERSGLKAKDIELL